MTLPDDSFQFLIGTIKTTSLGGGHRLPILFQFLIGTIKTKQLEDLKKASKGFQFLIGTIKTKRGGFERRNKMEFQFLIGTIKTTLSELRGRKLQVVSIPYRYYKNPSTLHATCIYILTLCNMKSQV